MSLYAQHGYGKGSKIDKGLNEGDINGVILSPKAETPEKIFEYSQQLSSNHPNATILFDPQFFVCNFQGDINSGKLPLYPYFQSDLSRSKLSNPQNIHNYTQKVFDFQSTLRLKSIISPTIAIDSFDGRESQIAVSLAYESISVSNNPEKTLISLCINENAFNNKPAMEEFLNVISLLDAEGFYIIIERESNTSKPTEISPNKLTNIMYFLYILSEVNLYNVILGYSDLLSIPLSVVGNITFSSGWYSNLKSFSEANYRPSTGGRRPRKRYSSDLLMGSLLLIPEIITLTRNGLQQTFRVDSPYNAALSSESSWTDEISCLHNWHILSRILTEIDSQSSISNKISLLKNKIISAMESYSIIERSIPMLDSKSNGSHLSLWEIALEQIESELGI